MGRFAQADKGTLFLDEIGDINAETQIKLLRVLQERRFEPVGGATTIEVDVRLITATHQNLERLIREGKFREDLFYRLNVITIQLPALRERREDVIQLVGHFMERSARKTGKMIQRIEPAALKALEEYPWPGNIRELENAMERAVVMAESQELLLVHFPMEVQEFVYAHQFTDSGVYIPFMKENSKAQTRKDIVKISGKKSPPVISKRVNYESRIGENAALMGENDERALIMAVLNECQGNKTEAARKLGMPRSTYYSKLKKYQDEG
jgi:DNA-binding NtrC family response regulator